MTTHRIQLDRHLLSLHRQEELAEIEAQALNDAEEETEAAVEALAIAQAVASTIQRRALEQISEVVTKCLDLVFEDEAYAFRILFDQKRGQTEARCVFERDGLQIDPLTAAGGGMVDVAAFALRLACLVLSQPQRRSILILDEPFKFVSEEYRGRVRQMLETLTLDLNLQIVLVTHINELKIGRIFEI